MRSAPLTRATAALAAGLLAVAAALWATVAYGFYAHLKTDLVLRIGATLFFLAAAGSLFAYGVGLIRAIRGRLPEPGATPGWLRWAFVAAVPASILAMSMACGFPGCTTYCKVLTAGSVVMGGLAAREALRGDAAPLLLLFALAYAVPHCTCANPINIAWIDAIGVSPNCFAFPLVTILLATLGLRGLWPRLTGVLCLGPAGAAAAFGFGHQLLHYPW